MPFDSEQWLHDLDRQRITSLTELLPGDRVAYWPQAEGEAVEGAYVASSATEPMPGKTSGHMIRLADRPEVFGADGLSRGGGYLSSRISLMDWQTDQKVQEQATCKELRTELLRLDVQTLSRTQQDALLKMLRALQEH